METLVRLSILRWYDRHREDQDMAVTRQTEAPHGLVTVEVE